LPRPRTITREFVRPAAHNLYQVACKTHRLNLPDGSFNASILDVDDGFLLAYRPNEEKISLCFVDNDFRVDESSDFTLPLNCIADPRLIKTPDGRVLLSYSQYKYGSNQEYIAANFVLDLNKKKSLFCSETIRVSPFNLKPRQKNWMPFVCDNKIYFISNVIPHEIYELNIQKRATSVKAYATLWNPNWLFGKDIRGNTNAIRLSDDVFMATFHTSTPLKSTLYYDNGCYTFEAKPPFRPIHCAKKTYMPAESATEPYFRKHHQIVCTFPCGMVKRGDKLFISYGDNDSCVKIMETTVGEMTSTLLLSKGNHAD
jgi:predicted GH43/DUF377 family glycosyl hydrolase